MLTADGHGNIAAATVRTQMTEQLWLVSEVYETYDRSIDNPERPQRERSQPRATSRGRSGQLSPKPKQSNHRCSVHR